MTFDDVQDIVDDINSLLDHCNLVLYTDFYEGQVSLYSKQDKSIIPLSEKGSLEYLLTWIRGFAKGVKISNIDWIKVMKQYV